MRIMNKERKCMRIREARFGIRERVKEKRKKKKKKRQGGREVIKEKLKERRMTGKGKDRKEGKR